MHGDLFERKFFFHHSFIVKIFKFDAFSSPLIFRCYQSCSHKQKERGLKYTMDKIVKIMQLCMKSAFFSLYIDSNHLIRTQIFIVDKCVKRREHFFMSFFYRQNAYRLLFGEIHVLHSAMHCFCYDKKCAFFSLTSQFKSINMRS